MPDKNPSKRPTLLNFVAVYVDLIKNWTLFVPLSCLTGVKPESATSRVIRGPCTPLATC